MAKTPKRLKNARGRHGRSCEGKQVYPNRKLAEAAAVAMREKKNWRRISAYRCAACGNWHLGRRSHD